MLPSSHHLRTIPNFFAGRWLVVVGMIWELRVFGWFWQRREYRCSSWRYILILSPNYITYHLAKNWLTTFLIVLRKGEILV